MADTYRIGEAAEILGVRVETLRRWERDGKLKTQRTRPAVSGWCRRPRWRACSPPIGARSRSSRGARATASRGVITEIKTDKLSATVEIQAGPHRILAFITREAVDQLGLRPGMEAVATVKATSVMVNLPE